MMPSKALYIPAGAKRDAESKELSLASQAGNAGGTATLCDMLHMHPRSQELLSEPPAVPL